MIILDTNVVSEAMKPEPNPAVRAWLNDQAAETLYLSSVTLAELLFGIAALPSGKRKEMLAQTLDGLMGLFRDRVLPFELMPHGTMPSWPSQPEPQDEDFPPLMAT